MKVNIRGKNIEITEAMKVKIHTQMNKLTKYSLIYQNPNVTVRIIVKNYPKINKQKIEVTIPLNNQTILRAESSDEDFYRAVDNVIEKIIGQIRKCKVQNDKRKYCPLSELITKMM